MKHAIFIILMILIAVIAGTNGVFAQTDHEKGNLVLTSNIKDCYIFIDGDSTGQRTPALFIQQEPGIYMIGLRDIYGKKVEKQVTIYADKKNEIQIDFPVSSLYIDSNIPVEFMSINDVSIPKEQLPPVLFENLASGDYNILLKDNYGHSMRQQIFLNPGKKDTTYIKFDLGNLTVESTPSKAIILLNGQMTEFKTPHTFTGVSAGLYTISVERGRKQVGEKINLLADEDNKVKLKFERSKWWKYAAYGGALVGGGVVYLITQDDEKDDKPGIADPNWPPTD